MSRREFLYYVWGASIALLGAQTTGLLIWFLIPRFREGEFGGAFRVDASMVPPVNGEPVNVSDGRFWLVNLDTGADQGKDRMFLAPDESEQIVGVAAIYKVCTHLGCIYSWVPANNRFECPCHGSKYRLDGRRIESPAPRSLDRFALEATDDAGNVLAVSPVDDDGFFAPLTLPEGTTTLVVDTGARAEGPSRSLLCSFTDTCP
jgi:cytochrome b6-f complex iron-sulfur subunit